MSLLDLVFQIAFSGGKFLPKVDVSENYKHWISQIDWKRCMESIKAGTATMNGTDGADWTLKYEGGLPDYYITIEDIYDLGWKKA